MLHKNRDATLHNITKEVIVTKKTGMHVTAHSTGKK